MPRDRQQDSKRKAHVVCCVGVSREVRQRGHQQGKAALLNELVRYYDFHLFVLGGMHCLKQQGANDYHHVHVHNGEPSQDEDAASGKRCVARERAQCGERALNDGEIHAVMQRDHTQRNQRAGEGAKIGFTDCLEGRHAGAPPPDNALFALCSGGVRAEGGGHRHPIRPLAPQR